MKETDDFDDMMVDFTQCVEIKQKKSLYDKDYDTTTTKFYRTLRENKTNVIMLDTDNFYPDKSFCFKQQWDPYTGIRTGDDPYGGLYFHPDDLIRYFYLKRLNKLWTFQEDLNTGFYDNGVGAGESMSIVGRGNFSEAYLFRLPIHDCYLEKNCDLSLITMGPKLTNEELEEIDTLAEKYYKNNYKLKYNKMRPSLKLMKALYDQAISKEPDLSKLIIEYKDSDDVVVSDSELKSLRDKANRLAVDALRKM